ncbi:transposase [Craurococcus roseus]|uniref:transposase n=1 Tax=Craurococcus roseus TaxID=77585 RepID=UPI0038D23DA7
MRDRAAYDRALARRGAITVWVSPDAAAWWRALAGRHTFSDAAIAAALTVRAVYRLALRQAEGLVGPISALPGLALTVPPSSGRGGSALDRGTARSFPASSGRDFFPKSRAPPSPPARPIAGRRCALPSQ